jgi:hypothetical protein
LLKAEDTFSSPVITERGCVDGLPGATALGSGKVAGFVNDPFLFLFLVETSVFFLVFCFR